jgi:hypothetical protein
MMKILVIDDDLGATRRAQVGRRDDRRMSGGRHLASWEWQESNPLDSLGLYATAIRVAGAWS